MLPYSFNSLTIFGFMLLLGLIGGQAAKSTNFLPRITGYMLIGLIFGPNVFNIITPTILSEAKVYSDIAIALVLYRLGLQIRYTYVITHTNLIISSVVECAFTFLLVYISLIMLNVYWLHAMLAAIISMTSFPIMNKLRNNPSCYEIITSRSMTLAASNNLIAFVLFILVIPCIHLAGTNNDLKFYNIFVDPLYRLLGPVMLACTMGCLMRMINKFIGDVENLQFILVIAIITLSVGLARTFSLPSSVTALMLGMVITNLDDKKYPRIIDPGHGGEILFILLFVVAGAKLHITQFMEAWLIALSFVAARFVGKLIPSLVLSRSMGLTLPQSYVSTLTLYPMAGMAISLVNIAQDISSELSFLSSIVLAAISIIETTAPFLSRVTLRKPAYVVGAELVLHR